MFQEYFKSIQKNYLAETESSKHTLGIYFQNYHHFIQVVNVLDYSIKTMEKLDELTKEWI